LEHSVVREMHCDPLGEVMRMRLGTTDRYISLYGDWQIRPICFPLTARLHGSRNENSQVSYTLLQLTKHRNPVGRNEVCEHGDPLRRWHSGTILRSRAMQS